VGMGGGWNWLRTMYNGRLVITGVERSDSTTRESVN
jgi:hypothetical protein